MAGICEPCLVTNQRGTQNRPRIDCFSNWRENILNIWAHYEIKSDQSLMERYAVCVCNCQWLHTIRELKRYIGIWFCAGDTYQKQHFSCQTGHISLLPQRKHGSYLKQFAATSIQYCKLESMHYAKKKILQVFKRRFRSFSRLAPTHQHIQQRDTPQHCHSDAISGLLKRRGQCLCCFLAS